MISAWIEEVRGVEPQLPEEALARMRESVRVWSLRYGAFNGKSDHTAAYFGMTHASAGIVTMWASIEPAGLRPSHLRAGLKLWRAFIADWPWLTYAHCDLGDEQKRRFLLWLGFTPHSRTNEFEFFERAPHGR